MAKTGSITRLVGSLKEGNESSAAELWERFFPRLVNLARQKLGSCPRRESDEEDVALSVLDSVFRRAKEGRFRQLENRQDLWQLLVVITSRKSANARRLNARQKRGGGRVQESPRFEAIVAKEPSPEFAVMVAEQCNLLLDNLPNDSLRRVAVMKLEGNTNKEIAQALNCQERTVERKLGVIRSQWQRIDDVG